MFVGVGFLLTAAGGVLVWFGNELRTTPAPIAISALALDPEAERLLKRIYELQTHHDLYKLVISHDGTLLRPNAPADEPEINLIESLFGGKRGDEQSQRALEKLMLEIPVTYLRNIPQANWDTPYVVAVTPEGRAYLRSRQH